MHEVPAAHVKRPLEDAGTPMIRPSFSAWILCYAHPTVYAIHAVTSARNDTSRAYGVGDEASSETIGPTLLDTPDSNSRKCVLEIFSSGNTRRYRERDKMNDNRLAAVRSGARQVWVKAGV